MANNKKILIVDDDVYVRDIYEAVLKDAGFTVSTAVDGEEGLVKAAEGGYDLVLLDMMMPKLDGLQVLTALKNKPPKEANGGIVMLTNLAHDSVIKEGIGLGAKAYLIKSDLNPDQLVEQVKKFLA